MLPARPATPGAWPRRPEGSRWLLLSLPDALVEHLLALAQPTLGELLRGLGLADRRTHAAVFGAFPVSSSSSSASSSSSSSAGPTDGSCCEAAAPGRACFWRALDLGALTRERADGLAAHAGLRRSCGWNVERVAVADLVGIDEDAAQRHHGLFASVTVLVLQDGVRRRLKTELHGMRRLFPSLHRLELPQQFSTLCLSYPEIVEPRPPAPRIVVEGTCFRLLDASVRLERLSRLAQVHVFECGLLELRATSGAVAETAWRWLSSKLDGAVSNSNGGGNDIIVGEDSDESDAASGGGKLAPAIAAPSPDCAPCRCIILSCVMPRGTWAFELLRRGTVLEVADVQQTARPCAAAHLRQQRADASNKKATADDTHDEDGDGGGGGGGGAPIDVANCKGSGGQVGYAHQGGQAFGQGGSGRSALIAPQRQTTNLVGAIVAAADRGGSWRVGTVLRVREASNDVLVRYHDWDERWNDCVPLEAGRIRLLHKPRRGAATPTDS